MTEVYEILKLADDGTVLGVETKRTWMLPVKSTDMIPKDCPIYTQAFVVDKLDIAVCDGEDKWYAQGSGGVVSATAGQSWSALFG